MAKERVEVELHSTEPSAVEATRQTFRALAGGSHDLVEEDGKFYVVTDNPGFVRFAAERQGYVRRVR